MNCDEGGASDLETYRLCFPQRSELKFRIGRSRSGQYFNSADEWIARWTAEVDVDSATAIGIDDKLSCDCFERTAGRGRRIEVGKRTCSVDRYVRQPGSGTTWVRLTEVQPNFVAASRSQTGESVTERGTRSTALVDRHRRRIARSTRVDSNRGGPGTASAEEAVRCKRTDRSSACVDPVCCRRGVWRRACFRA